MPTRPSSSAADGCSAPTRRFARVTRSPTCSLTLALAMALPPLVALLSRALPDRAESILAGFRAGPRRSRSPARAALASPAERQVSGGPSGLQNRQAGAALRLDGSIPSPLRGSRAVSGLSADSAVGLILQACPEYVPRWA